MEERVLLVRATIHLPGFPLGEVRWVDQDEPYVQECLAAEILVPVEPTAEDA